MIINSPISNFIKVLEQVKEKAQKNRIKLSKSEATTRIALIDPVLTALGWDLSNPDMVEFEHSLSDTRIDYALYNENNEVKAIIEAKSLDGNLNDQKILTKLVSYVYIHKIHDIFLTDGLVWQHYQMNELGNVDPISMNLAKESLTDIATYLINKLDAIKYWEHESTTENIENHISLDNIVNESSQIKQESNQTTIHNPPSNSDSITSSQTIIIKPGFYTLESILNENLVSISVPQKMLLPDGKIINISKWRQVLSESILFVLKHNSNLEIPIYDKAGKSIKLISDKPIDNPGSILPSKYHDKDVWLYLNYSARNCVENAIYILKKLPSGYYKNTVQVSIID